MTEHAATPSNPPAGAPVPPQYGAPMPAAGAPVPPPAPKKSAGKKVLSILAAVVAGLVVIGIKVGAGSLFNDDKTAEAKVGDCIAKLPEVGTGEQKEAPDAKVVECTATDAAYNVVGRVENQTEAQAAEGKACEQYVKEGEEYYIFSSIKPGGTGYLLCLKPKA